MKKDPLGEVYLSAEQIQDRVKELGKMISATYQGKELLLLGILKGSFVFMADLVRNIEIPHSLDFMAISSYEGVEGSPEAVKILKDLDESITGKHVVIVEDIIDTGLTLGYLIRHLEARNPGSINICTLLDRSIRRIVPLPISFTGFDIPDVFVVGYGMDYRQLYRNLPSLHLCDITV
ncbi:MAG: hypoxanthine phosphoribosyltransferase [Syntrophobacterales bacterium]|jgi:hypoxanthine phosphoribosyltransferase